MGKSNQQPNFSFGRYLELIDSAPDDKTIAALAVLAMAQYRNKKLSLQNLSQIFTECGAKLYTFV